MCPDTPWERAKALFEEAQPLAAEDRLAFLERACRDDPELRYRMNAERRHGDPGRCEPVAAKLALAVAPARLGEDAVIGQRTWHAQSRFRVVLGPLTFPDYERFLPRGKSSRALLDLIRLYVGLEHSWEVRLVLKKDDVPLAWLGNSVWIGWTSWLGARLTGEDAADYSNPHGRHLPHWTLESKQESKVVH